MKGNSHDHEAQFGEIAEKQKELMRYCLPFLEEIQMLYLESQAFDDLANKLIEHVEARTIQDWQVYWAFSDRALQYKTRAEAILKGVMLRQEYLLKLCRDLENEARAAGVDDFDEWPEFLESFNSLESNH